MDNEFYNGILYQIEYKPEYSNNDYTQHFVYYIHTDDDSFPHAKKAVESIMDDGSWSRGLYLLKCKNGGIMEALHTYHTFTYDEELNVFIYTFVRPYDD